MVWGSHVDEGIAYITFVLENWATIMPPINLDNAKYE